MKRIAFFGPLPPSKTGIADYDHALLPLLSRDFEVDVFTPETHGDFLLRHKQKPYDLNLYQLGNDSRFHEYMYGYLFQNPGAVVFHDTCLHHSRADMLLKRQMMKEYRAELREVYGEDADKIANAAITFAAGDLMFYQYPFFELVLQSSLAAAAHTDWSVQRLSISGTPVVKIPHLQLPAPAIEFSEPAAGKFVIASFGYATAAKRNATVLETITDLRARHPDLLFVIAGQLEQRAQLQHQIEESGLQKNVLLTGYLDAVEFQRWIERADVIVNLRFPSTGEMSGTLIRSLAAGKPVIISRLANLQEIPRDAVLRVRPDREREDLTAMLDALMRDSQLRGRVAANAKRFIEEHHSDSRVRAQYRSLIETALSRKAQYAPPQLPFHLRSAEEMLRNDLEQSTLIPLSKLRDLGGL
jgi:glycosyltransferase involved in cell wall biosynthesis